MCLSSAGPCLRPCLSNSTRRGQRFRRDFLFALVGSSPAGAFAALLPHCVRLCVSPPWWLCAAFSFSRCKFTRLYFSFVLRPSCTCVRCLRSLRCRAWRFPWPSAGRSRGGGGCISCRRCSRLRASGAAVGRSGSRRGRRRSGRVRRGPADFFRWSALPAPPRLPGVRLPETKSLGVKSRPRQPFSRSAGLNYSRSSSADNSAIFLLIDSFFCAATKSLNAFAANSHL